MDNTAQENNLEEKGESINETDKIGENEEKNKKLSDEFEGVDVRPSNLSDEPFRVDNLRLSHLEDDVKSEGDIPETTGRRTIKFTDEEIAEKKAMSKSFEGKPYVLDPDLFHVIKKSKKQGTVKSIFTILSIWNTMIGSSSVTMPKFVMQAGVFGCIIINVIFMLICFYTARIVVKTGGKDLEYADAVARYFGKYFGQKYSKVGKVLQIIFNLAINIGATFIYFLIINQNFYPVIAVILQKCGVNITDEEVINPTASFTKFSMVYTAIIISVIVFPLLILKDMGKIVKINSFGIYFVSILLIFEIIMSFVALANTDFKFEYIKNDEKTPGNTRYLYFFGSKPSALCGALSLGYFSHSFVLPVMASNAKQENNIRDLFLGYLCVCLTYIIVGILGYIAFAGKDFKAMGEFKDNWFMFFGAEHKLYIFVMVLRVLNVFQMCSILPVLFYIIRIQLFGAFIGKAYPSKLHVIVFAICLLVISFVIMVLMKDKLGKLLSFVGAFTGLFLIYIIPGVVNVVYYGRRHPENLEELQRQKKEGLLDLTPKDKDDYGFTDKPMNKIKNFFFYLSHTILIIFGFFVLIMQFVTINFFGIHLKEVNPATFN